MSRNSFGVMISNTPILLSKALNHDEGIDGYLFDKNIREHVMCIECCRHMKMQDFGAVLSESNNNGVIERTYYCNDKKCLEDYVKKFLD